MPPLPQLAQRLGRFLPLAPGLVQGPQMGRPLLFQASDLFGEQVDILALSIQPLQKRRQLRLQQLLLPLALGCLFLGGSRLLLQAFRFLFQPLPGLLQPLQLLLPGHEGHLLLRGLVVDAGIFASAGGQFRLHTPYVLLAGHIARFQAALGLPGLRALLVYIVDIVLKLAIFPLVPLQGLLVFLHILLKGFHLFPLGRQLQILGVQGLGGSLQTLLRRRQFPLHLPGMARLLPDGFGKLGKPLLQLLDLPLPADQAELPLLGAAAGHGTTGVDDVPLQSGDAKCALCLPVDGHARFQVLHQYRSAQQVFKDPTVPLRISNQLAGHA